MKNGGGERKVLAYYLKSSSSSQPHQSSSHIKLTHEVPSEIFFVLSRLGVNSVCVADKSSRWIIIDSTKCSLARPSSTLACQSTHISARSVRYSEMQFFHPREFAQTEKNRLQAMGVSVGGLFRTARGPPRRESSIFSYQLRRKSVEHLRECLANSHTHAMLTLTV